jgi:aminoglycoside phosphotransferase (APT) family kinase protein
VEKNQNIAPEGLPEHNIVIMDNANFIDAMKVDFGIELRASNKIIGGFQNQVYKALTTDGRNIFIRINKDRRPLETEVWGYAKFKELGIPVPEVISYKANPSTIGYPTMVMSAAEGKNIDEVSLASEQEEAIYENVGSILRKINGVRVEGFGPVKIIDGQPKGKFASWAEYFVWWKKRLDEAVDFLKENNLITSEEVQKIYKVFAELEALNVKQAFLLHRDIHPEHIFVDQNKVTGIIDLGRLQGGDPRYDIAMSLFFQNEKRQEYFKKGYGEITNDPVVSKFLVITATTKTMFRTQRRDGGAAKKSLQFLKDTLSKL